VSTYDEKGKKKKELVLTAREPGVHQGKAALQRGERLPGRLVKTRVGWREKVKSGKLLCRPKVRIDLATPGKDERR